MRTTRLIPLLSILLLMSSAVAGRTGVKVHQETPPKSEAKKKSRTLKPGRYLFRLTVEQPTGQIVRIEKTEDGLSLKFLENPITIDGEAGIGLEIVRKRWGIYGRNEKYTDFAFKIGDDGRLSAMVERTVWNSRTGIEQPPVSLELTGEMTDDTHAAGTYVARTIVDSGADSALTTGQWSMESVESELAEIEADPKAIVRRQNTASAMQMLRNIHSAQAVFESGIGEGQFTNDLRRLGGGERSDEVGLLDVTVVQAQYLPKRGYLLGPITCRIKTPTTSAGYFIICYPVMASGDDRTGDDCFYVDETGIVRHSGAPDVPAGPDSPPIGN